MVIALVGPDGAGKSTVAREVAARLRGRVTCVYMGVNLDSASHMLPTTRLARALAGLVRRRSASGSPRLPTDADATAAWGPKARGAGYTIRSLLRLVGWLAEEWFRQALVWLAAARGRVVLLDRHFFLDFFAYDVTSREGPIARRMHGLVLRRLYPRPDVVVFLDAPAEVLLARKGEGTMASIERRRREYLSAAPHVPRFIRIDADRPIEAVAADVVVIAEQAVARRGRRPWSRRP
jgi:thymidylate kinase